MRSHLFHMDSTGMKIVFIRQILNQIECVKICLAFHIKVDNNALHYTKLEHKLQARIFNLI